MRKYKIAERAVNVKKEIVFHVKNNTESKKTGFLKALVAKLVLLMIAKNVTIIT